MVRSTAPELGDDPNLDEETLQVLYSDVTATHRWLGNTRVVLRALERNPFPVQRVLDIGCGRGDLLVEIRRRLNVEAIGIDLRRLQKRPPLPILNGDAVRQALPHADVALAVAMIHHLSECDVVELIRNVARSARRFIILDFVRHALPLALFRLAVHPFLSRVAAHDGMQTLRRSYTVAELSGLVGTALGGRSADVRHTVGPFYTRQMVDIRFG